MLSLEYVAGLFDGEGNIRVLSQRINAGTTYKVMISITNTYAPVIELLLEMFPQSNCDRQLKHDGKRRTAYQWRMTGSNAVSFLSSVLPYLIIKKEQAQLAIQLHEFLGSIRERFPWKPKYDQERRTRIPHNYRFSADEAQLLDVLAEAITDFNKRGPID